MGLQCLPNTIHHTLGFEKITIIYSTNITTRC